MLCGHELDELAIDIDHLTPTLHKSTSHQTHKRGRLHSLEEAKSVTSDGNDVDSFGIVNGLKGQASISGSKQLSSLNKGFDKCPSHSINGAISGEKTEDRQAMLEKKYKVEKVKSASNHLSSHQHPHPQNSSLVPMFPDGRYEDNSVPFPRTSGATFCSNDFLVVFNVPSSLKKLDQESEVTPRSLSDLVRVTAPSHWKRPPHPFVSLFGNPSPPVPSEGVSISDFFTHNHHHHRKYSNQKSSHGHGHSHSRSSRDTGDGRKDREREMTDRVKKRLQKVARVQIYDISPINPVSLFLAKNYKLDLADVKGCCEHNAKVACKDGRKDLMQMWKVIYHVSEAVRKCSDNDDSQPWAMMPFGRTLINKYFNYYKSQRDVQTMAMIACMFWDPDTQHREALTQMSSVNFPRVDSRLSFEGGNVVMLGTSTDSGWELLMNKGKRSRSLSESFDDFNTIEKDPLDTEERGTAEKEVDSEIVLHNSHKRILSPDLTGQYEQIKRSYANILYKWGLLNQRTQILKHIISAQSNKKCEFSIPCSGCSDTVMNVQCSKCRYPSLNCSICHIGVRGPANVCLACGHGGHSSHMMTWFHSQSQCPSGCGCYCLKEAPL